MCFMYISGFFCIDCSSLIWSNEWFAQTNKQTKKQHIKYIYIFQMSQEINIFISCSFCCYRESWEYEEKGNKGELKQISNSKKYFLYLFPFNMTYCGVIWQFQSWNLLFHPDCCELKLFISFKYLSSNYDQEFVHIVLVVVCFVFNFFLKKN